MKNQTLLIRIVLLLAVVGAVGLVVSHNIKGKARPGAAQKAGDNDGRTLKEKAKQAGRFVGTEAPNLAARQQDLTQLANRSRAVVIGTAEGNVCRLSADGKRATIDYTVKIEYAYKGDLKEGSSVTVSLPGGSVAFPDGSSAEVSTPWFKKMQGGSTYLLFLSDGPGAGSYVTTGQAQGVWEIPTGPASRTVTAHTGLMNDPMWKYQNMDVKAFLKEVRKATSNKGAKR